MRLKAEERLAKRQALLEAGQKLMNRQGYAGTGVSEITKEVGMPKGSFFNYFPSKEHFAVEMIQDYCDNSTKYILNFLQDTSYSPLERIKRYYAENIRWHQLERNYEHGCILNELSLEVGENSELIAQAIKTCLSALLHPIVECLAQAQALGEIAAVHDPQSLAFFIDNSWRGVMTTTSSTKDPAAIEAFWKYTFEIVLK